MDMLDQSDLRLLKIFHNFYELRNSIKEGGEGKGALVKYTMGSVFE